MLFLAVHCLIMYGSHFLPFVLICHMMQCLSLLHLVVTESMALILCTFSGTHTNFRDAYRSSLVAGLSEAWSTHTDKQQ